MQLDLFTVEGNFEVEREVKTVKKLPPIPTIKTDEVKFTDIIQSTSNLNESHNGDSATSTTINTNEKFNIFDFVEDEQLTAKDNLNNQDRSLNVDEPTAYEEGMTVSIIVPSEESDPEMYNYLHYYYAHLKGKKGKIKRVLTYKKLQYLIEFDVKHEDRTLILYHENLQWISN